MEARRKGHPLPALPRYLHQHHLLSHPLPPHLKLYGPERVVTPALSHTTLLTFSAGVTQHSLQTGPDKDTFHGTG